MDHVTHAPRASARADLTTLTRKPDRQATARAELDAFLDSQLVGTLASVVDGQPWVVPMLFGRDGASPRSTDSSLPNRLSTPQRTTALP